MDKHTLKADKRTLTGKKVRSLRREGFVPANIFGKKIKSLAIQLKQDDFGKLYKEAGETSLIDLAVGSEKYNVLISDVQIHPIDDKPLHVDFRQVDLKEKVTATIPVETVGESPAEKSGLGTAVQLVDEVEVEALPTDLIEKFEVNIDELTEVDQAIFIKDLKYDKSKIEMKSDPEMIIVKVEPPQKEEVIEEPVVAEGEEVQPEAEAPTEETAAETPEQPAE
jgi:large subunit ribosomal protein L25